MDEYILAIETGGTKIQMALGTKDGTIIYNYRTVVNRGNGFQGILDTVCDSLPELKAEAVKKGGIISVIGIGFGGPVNTEEGVAIWSAQIDGWKGFPIKEFFEEKTNITTYVFNDSDAAAWGEYCKGEGKGSQIFFYTNMGSGVGGGVVIHGKLFTGNGYGAMEFGQSYLYDPNKSGKYPINHVEKICSGWGIEHRLRNDLIPATSLLWQLCNGEQDKINCLMWAEGIKGKDEYSLNVLDEVSELFSIAISNAICFFSPQIVAIGGGVSLIGEPLISRLNYYTNQYVYENCKGKYKIVKSALDESIVLVGGLLLTGEKAEMEV